MPSLASDWNFVPKVWSDHIMAYFDKLLLFGAVAAIDRTLTEKPGTTHTFPFYNSIGGAQKPQADEPLIVDKLTSDSFSATVYEVGKAVGVSDSAIMASGDGGSPEEVRGNFEEEAQRQMARVIAEQADADIITELEVADSHFDCFTSSDASAANRMTVSNILEASITAFGDKHEQAVAIYMHSQHFLDTMRDSTAGFLKADANDPFWKQPGFRGRLMGMALFITDQCPQQSDIASKKAYAAYIMKANPYGIAIKKDMQSLEKDRDTLMREWVVSGTTWMTVKSFHAKISTLDRRVGKMTVATNVAA